MQQQLQHLETEIARLQIELRQVRQLIGSLINTEESTHQLMRNQQAMGQQQLPQQYVQEEMQAPHHYNTMRQMSERMNGQLNEMAQPFQQYSPYRSHPMTPHDNDPMQRSF